MSMIKSPSKFLSRPFLKRLTENRFISPRGLEYSEPEVTELLTIKEMNQAEIDFRREQKERVQLLDHAQIMRNFQDSIFVSRELGILKGSLTGPSTVDAASLFAPTPLLQLPVKKGSDLLPEHQKIKQQAGGLVDDSFYTRKIAQPPTGPSAYRKGKPAMRITGDVPQQDRKRKYIAGMKVLEIREVTSTTLAQDLAATEKLQSSISNALKSIAKKSLKKARTK